MSLAAPRWGVVWEQPTSVLYASIRQKLWFFFRQLFHRCSIKFHPSPFRQPQRHGPDHAGSSKGPRRITAGQTRLHVQVETSD